MNTTEIDFTAPVAPDELPLWERVSRQRSKTIRIDAGLALLSLVSKRNEPLTLDDIAAWCDCSRERVRQIEESALKKIRMRLNKDELELVAHLGRSL